MVQDYGALPETVLLLDGSLIFIGLLKLFGGFVWYQNNGWGWLLGICMTRTSTIRHRSIER